MLELLLLIIGCYVMAALLVHLTFWIGQRRSNTGKHYVLIAGEGQKNMEWYLRMLHSFSGWIGKDVQLTLVDMGVSEETMAIVDRWRRSGKAVHIHVLQSQETEKSLHGGKRLQGEDSSYHHLLWKLQAQGVVSDADHAILVDLQNPADLSKMPF